MNNIHPKTRQQVAAEYGIHPLTLARRLRKLGLNLPPGNILPGFQKAIYVSLGYPGGIDVLRYANLPLPEPEYQSLRF